MILTEETSTGNRKIMTNDKNQTTNVEIVTTGFCLLIFEYLCSRNRAKRKAKINSTVSRMPAKT